MKISLCMIARNEEQNLDHVLRSVEPVKFDEIIVVDTGSEDSTREVAQRRGARVVDFNARTNPEAFFPDTLEECARFGAPGAYSGEVALGDFAAARNESFRHATGDFVMWLDADDELQSPEHVRGVAADLAQRGLAMAFLAYDYAVDAAGNVYYRQWRERLLRRGVARWVNPVHEVLLPHQPVPHAQYESPFVTHRRKPDRKTIPHRNYKILLRQMWQLKTANPSAPLDPRTLFYLGQESRFVEPLKAVGFYEEYLKSSGWPEERAAAHLALGSMLEFGQIPMPVADVYAKADLEYAAASAEMPGNPDGLLGLARVAYLRGRHVDCVRYTEQAFRLGNPESMLGSNPQDRIYRPHVYYNHALSFLGRLEEAVASCKAGLAVRPDDPGVPGGSAGMLKTNLAAYELELEKRRVAMSQPAADRPVLEFDKNEDVEAPPARGVGRDVQVIWAMQLWKQIVASGDGARARAFLDALPSAVAADPVIERMFRSTERRFPLSPEHALQRSIETSTAKALAAPKVPFTEAGAPLIAALRRDRGLDVVIWTGSAPESWTPNTPEEKGLGGSETAAIEVARGLAALGHRVVVYAECLGTFSGVEYRHHTTFRGADCDVFISSRVPPVVDHGPIRARLKLLWVHDINCGPSSPQMERWLLQFDRVLCLSKWHKDFVAQSYPTLHPDQIVVTRNGIDPSRFSGELPAKTNSLVFSSSPNRGLHWLVHNFHASIKQRIPDAELHVFYGFDTWETFAQARGDHAELAEIAQFKSILPPLGGSANGVFNHGKRPQREVAAAQLRAKVWGYLTQFTETSCITAMESMAAGAVPVCSRVAALPETVGDRGIYVDNDAAEPAVDFCDKVVALMQDEPRRAELAARGRKWALENLSWSALCSDWETMFYRLIDEVAADPLPRWRSAS